MSNELFAPPGTITSGDTGYCILRNYLFQVRDTVGANWEAFTAGQDSRYAITATEQDDGSFLADMPSGVGAATYKVEFYRQDGGSPAVITDAPPVWTYDFDWGGTTVTPPTVESGLPDEAALTDYLTAYGLLDDPPSATQSLLDLAVIISAAVSEWERATRWRPFVAAADNSSRYFDYPDIYNSRLVPGGGYMLDLRAGIASLNYIKLDGEALTQDTDFEPYPLCAPDADRPYTHVEFLLSRRAASRRAIEISGRWGYCLSDAIPSDVYQAILDMAARLASFSLRSLQTGGGASRVKQGPVEYEYGGTSSGVGAWFAPATLNERINGAVLSYRRQSFA